MNYAERLQAAISQRQATGVTDKTATTQPVVVVAGAEARSVSFGSSADSRSQRTEIEEHLVRLLPGRDHPNFAEMLSLALAHPSEYLQALRSSR